MKDFLLIYRRDGSVEASPEQMQAMMKPWQDWLGGIAAQKKLVDQGNRLASDGGVVKSSNVVTDGPYVELKEVVSGYSIVKAGDLKEAFDIAKGCPVLTIGGTVEVRSIIAM
ncbi:MAG TPA: YciI family protein [Cyclobacteriaceae bacterium]|nr:YciI family protein [Cyclobacteriaceae bacterium]